MIEKEGLTVKIINACMEVHNELVNDFLEPVYQEALEEEFKIQGIPYVREKLLPVMYKGKQLKKEYYADFVCYDDIIVELKAVSVLSKPHKAQVLNYLNAANKENMLPNRAGIITATTLPTGEYTPSFEIDGTLVSNIRSYFKKIWKATFSGGCSADVLVFKAKENVSKEYLYYVLADDEFFKYSMATSKETKMPRGDKTSIMNYPVKLPPSPHPAKNELTPKS